jgi:hypothetical protein
LCNGTSEHSEQEEEKEEERIFNVFCSSYTTGNYAFARAVVAGRQDTFDRNSVEREERILQF